MLIATLSSLAAAGSAAAGTLFSLQPGSTFARGCFPPCLCPVLFSDDVEGTFVLTLTDKNPLFNTYVVSGVNFNSPKLGYTVVGSGKYVWGGEVALTQSLEADLSVNGEPAEHYHSGVVPVGAKFPDISVTISINDMFCWDTVIHIEASPSGIPGDLNYDGCVDQIDLGIILADYGCTGGGCAGDTDLDGDTDQADLGALLAHYGEGC